MPELPILKYSNELEEAGWIGLAAASALGLFYAVGGPGATTSTDTGFVWTKSLLGSSAEQEINMGIGKLKVQNAALTASFGLQLKNGKPGSIDLMISFMGSGAAPSAFLEIDPKIAVLADKVMRPPGEDPPGADNNDRGVIGYENPGQPLQIKFPNAAIEFNFRFHPEKGILSSIQLYGGVGGIATAVGGIIEFNLDKVIVFPKLSGMGLYVDELFIDLTSDATTSFAGLFPEVYNPSWKGIGAKEITLLFPVDEGEKEFMAMGVQGFLLGFDKQFSASFILNYSNNKPGALLKEVRGEVQIRNNEFVKAEVSIAIDLSRGVEKLNVEPDDDTIDTGATDSEKKLVEETKAKTSQQDPIASIEGIIKGTLQFVHYDEDGEWAFGFGVIFNAVSTSDEPSGIIFRGMLARSLFWAAGGAVGVSLLRQGIREESPFKTIGSVALLFFVLADVLNVVSGDDGPQVLPQLETFSITKLGYRQASVVHSDGSRETFHEIIGGFRTEFNVESSLTEILRQLAETLLADLGLAGTLFGEELDQIIIRGKLDMEFDNYTYSNKPMPAALRTLFEQRDFHIRAKKLPEIVFEEEAASPSHIPKPMVSPEFVVRETESGETQYGVALKLEGLASADFSLNAPIGGLVIFFMPDFSVEVVPQLTILPKFVFVLPGRALAEGVIDINKPLPTGDKQTRIGIDVGLVFKGEEGGMKEYLKITNYKYRFGGEVAWGETFSNEVDPARKYGFLFVEVHYEGKSPLAVVLGVGIYGLGLIFGKNIRPGVQGGENNALGIANWIIGKKQHGVHEEDIFKSVRDWPSVPAADGSTWHPAIHFDTATQSFQDQYAIGLTVKVGSPADGGETYSGEAIGLVGFPEFWFAFGAIIMFKSINSELIVVVVIDRNSLVVKLVFEFKVNDEGSLVAGMVPIEVAVTKDPRRTWIYIGHYLDTKGGPVTLRILKELFTVKFYFVYDSVGLLQFGIMPIGDFAKPDITGKARGIGALMQWGPKKYGPSYANISLFAAFGFNIGFGANPNIDFGEIYLGGYVKLKFWIINAKLELLLVLSGMALDTGYRYAGLFTIRINLPWPLSDWKYTTDFVIQSIDFAKVLEPSVKSTASWLLRMAPRAENLPAEGMPTIPIDGIISISFDKPIYGVLNTGTPGIDQTELLLNNENPDDDKISETLELDYHGIRYLVHYVHVIDTIFVTRRALSGLGSILVFLEEAPATWEVPSLYKDGEPDPNAESHHTLFLNTLIPPNLQFSSEQMGQFNSWVEEREHIFPCNYSGRYCVILNALPRPEVDASGRELIFDTPYGGLVIRDEGVGQEEAEEDGYSGPLGWTPENDLRIALPYNTYYDLPFPTRVQLDLRLINIKRALSANSIILLKSLVQELRIEFEVKLRGRGNTNRFDIILTPDETVRCGWRAVLTPLEVNADEMMVSFIRNTCNEVPELVLEIDVQSLNPLYPVDYIKSSGYIIVMTPPPQGQQNDTLRDAQARSLLSGYRLRLADVCIEDTNHSSLHWLETSIGGGMDAGEAVDSLTDSMLFAPNHEYSVQYGVLSFATIYHVGEDGTELLYELEEPIRSTLQPVRFRTETEPTQFIDIYLAFCFPMKGMQDPYPDALTPMITFKNQGFIQKIYRKHYGADVLIPLLADIDGNEVPPVLQQTIPLYSSGSDEALEQLLQSCLPNAADFVNITVSIWERNLVVNTRYSLQLKDIHEPDQPKVPFTISFKTSRFRNMTQHVQYIENLFVTGAQDPLLDAPFFSNQMVAFINSIRDNTQAAFDKAIETFYLNFLGVDGGKLGPAPEEDYVSYIVGLSGVGDPEIWGIAIELVEPLIGKEGVSVDPVVLPGLEEKGIIITADNILIMRDASGSRILLFFAVTDTAFATITADITLDFVFKPKEAIRGSIAKYVLDTFIDKTPAQQATLIGEQLNVVTGLPNVGAAMAEVSATLTITMPVIL
ncbi:MAG: hypothetical protein WKF97_06175 [Chitinophagaceae bacterium]